MNKNRKINLPLLLLLLLVIQVVSLVCQVEGKKNGERKLKKIGVQLYTVRKEMEDDFDGTLRRIAEIGYDEVEFAGLFGRDPTQIRKFVGKLGMKISASHINWDTLKADPESAIRETKLLGAKYMVLAWFPPEHRQTLEQWKELIVFINRVAEMSHKKGIRFLYHNHDFEFKKIDGVEPFDLLLAGVDKRYVAFELDLYWLKLAGRDPEPLFARYPQGFPFSHVKDMSKNEMKMVDVGDGRIDFARIFSRSSESGMKTFIVEHDDTKNPFQTLERSLEYLRGLRF